MQSSPSSDHHVDRVTRDGPTSVPGRPASRNAPRRRTPWELIAILVIAAAPIVLGTGTFWYWRTAGQTNYGELIAPRQIDLQGTALDQQPIGLSEYRGKWRYLVFDSAACDETCRRKLLYTRQIRAAVGRDQDRVERFWIIDGDGISAEPDREHASLYAQAHVVRVHRAEDADRIAPAAERRGFIYLVDPYGNLMMRYPSDPDPLRMIKDLQRLLKYTKLN